MANHVSHNNDRKYYRIAIDTAKEGDEIFNLTEYFKGRVGDRNYGLQMTWYEQGSLKNVKGLKPYIHGNVGHYSIGDDGEIIMAPDAAVVSYVGDPSDTDVAGRVVYYFPEQMFPQEGIFYGFLGLLDDSDGDQRLSGVNVWFKVLGGVAYMGKASAYYIDEMDKLIHNSEERIRQLLDQGQKDVDAKQAALQAIVDDYKTKMSDLIDRLNAQGQTANSMMETVKAGLSALEAKIQQDGLFTQAEAEKLRKNLDTIVNSKSIHQYTTVADMVSDDQLVVGIVARTQGQTAFNDGGGADYLITDQPGEAYSIPLNNGLAAVKLFSGADMYYPEVTAEIKYDNNLHTTKYFVRIPKTDSQGNLIHPYLAKTGDQKAPSDYAREHHTTLTVNASLSTLTESGTWEDGHVIGNGRIINRKTYTKAVPDNFKYIGIKADRSVKEYPNSITPEEMLADGVTDAMMVYWPLVKNAQIVDMSGFEANEGSWHISNFDPRLALGVTASGDIIIGATDGRTMTDKGVTSQQMAQMMIDKGCVNAWHLDGGGSTSITLNESKLNKNLDYNGLFERQIHYTLNVRKDGVGGGLAQVYSKIGKEKQRTVDQLVALRNNFYGWNTKPRGTFHVKSDTDLEKFKDFIEDEMPALTAAAHGAGMIGHLFIDATDTKINQLTNQAFPITFNFHFSWDQNYGELVIENVSRKGQRLFMLFNSTRPDGDRWSEWHLDDQVVSVPTHKVYSGTVDRFDVTQNGQTVVVDAQLEVLERSKWMNAIAGLPSPIADTETKLFVCEDGTSLARLSVQKGGTLSVYGSMGTFPVKVRVHMAYVTNAKQPLINGEGADRWW